MTDYLSFKEFLDETSKPGQPVAPPKRPRSPKALVNVPHKRVKGPKKPTGQPIPPPSAEDTVPKKLKESAPLLNPERNPKKSEKAVAVVVPQKSKLQKFLSNFKVKGKSSIHKGTYAHARRGSISHPARKASPKHFKLEG